MGAGCNWPNQTVSAKYPNKMNAKTEAKPTGMSNSVMENSP
jgi:hypothetical protein